jgi:hypothetical protein
MWVGMGGSFAGKRAAGSVMGPVVGLPAAALILVVIIPAGMQFEVQRPVRPRRLGIAELLLVLDVGIGMMP